MKKTLTVILALILALCLSLVCFAKDVEEKGELRSYITEKIVPVVVGVLTAIVALITTLGAVARSLNELKETKSAFEGEAKERASSLEKSKLLFEEKSRELRETVKDMPQLKEMVSILIEESRDIAEILSLGFSSDKDIIKSGRGRKMSLLLDSLNKKAGVHMQEAKEEINEEG